MTQTWDPDSYLSNAGFVPTLGKPVLELLAPQREERILDLGCGDGSLTSALVAAGAEVVGIDASAEMIAAARARGLDARLLDATALPFEHEFDAVFSNAAIHWMTRPEAVVEGVVRALRPGGRFVGELGAHGNVAAIATALRAVLVSRSISPPNPWYFPTPAEWIALLGRHGLELGSVALIPRPTPLPTGMAGWLEVFGRPFLSCLPPTERAAARDEALALLAPALCDTEGNWTADYVRLRFAATRPDPG